MLSPLPVFLFWYGDMRGGALSPNNTLAPGVRGFVFEKIHMRRVQACMKSVSWGGVTIRDVINWRSVCVCVCVGRGGT